MKAKSNLARKAIPTMKRCLPHRATSRGSTGRAWMQYRAWAYPPSQIFARAMDMQPARLTTHLQDERQAKPCRLLSSMCMYFAWLTLRSMIHVLGLDLAPATRAMGLGRPLLPTFTQMGGVVVCSICLNRTPLDIPHSRPELTDLNSLEDLFHFCSASGSCSFRHKYILTYL